MRIVLLALAGLTAAGGVVVATMVGTSQSSAPLWPEMLVIIGGAVAVLGAVYI